MPVPVFTAGEVLTAANMNQVGLWKIGTFSTTSSSNLIVDSVFTSDFTNYRLVFSEVTGSGVTGLNFGYRSGGSTINANNYYGRRQDFSYAAGGAGGASDAPNTIHQMCLIISGNTTSPASAIIDIFAPQLNTRNTGVIGHGVDARTAGGLLLYSGFYNAQTAMDGFLLNAGGQTFTNAVVTVYGYRD